MLSPEAHTVTWLAMFPRERGGGEGGGSRMYANKGFRGGGIMFHEANQVWRRVQYRYSAVMIMILSATFPLTGNA